MKSKLFIFLFVSTAFYHVNSQTKELQSFLDTYTKENHFNGNILITKNDKVLFFKSYGMANQEFDIPNNRETKFKVASITKLFTSVLIYKLIDEGKLTLEKTIYEVLPNYKGEGTKKVNIHQLLTSTSGIEGLESGGDMVYEKKYTSDEVYHKFASGKLDTIPGTKFSYNNADYIILGKVLEEIHQKPFKTILKEQILDPLELNNTGILNYKVIDNLATTYWWNTEANQFERDIPYYGENYGASGNMYSNLGDLNTFSNALYSGKLISEKSLTKLLEPVEGVKDFDSYASGLWSFSFPIGNEQRHHGASRPGNIWGTEGMLFRLIEKEMNITILSNGMGSSDMWAILRKVQPILYKQ
ncbi:serine hydrolase domain-containing protein [Costertonia aggregata]|uniref:Beta-lactamase family protein n=1 Tax=Costertonia aggregata TaxID=343403 RepID=A0A7H9AR00_9FLAO|nr:serine hydrolase domain-containing protein [Costertonia aggregata]QLG45852.1 beta-lactamase family protein [Costertonia aggregata]